MAFSCQISCFVVYLNATLNRQVIYLNFITNKYWGCCIPLSSGFRRPCKYITVFTNSISTEIVFIEFYW